MRAFSILNGPGGASLPAALALALAPGCPLEHELPPPRAAAAECAATGLCVERATPSELAGSYREAELEMRFISLWRGYWQPDPAGSPLTVAPLYCSRIWYRNQLVWTELGSGCPADWTPGQVHGCGRSVAALGHRMAAAMHAAGPPNTTWTQPWLDVAAAAAVLGGWR